MIGVNVWWVYLAPQNIPRAISVLTLGNKVVLLYCISLTHTSLDPYTHHSKLISNTDPLKPSPMFKKHTFRLGDIHLGIPPSPLSSVSGTSVSGASVSAPSVLGKSVSGASVSAPSVSGASVSVGGSIRLGGIRLGGIRLRGIRLGDVCLRDCDGPDEWHKRSHYLEMSVHNVFLGTVPDCT